jgi:predicted phosphodiesterase
MSRATPPSPIRRLGVIGDVHAEHEALRVALDFLRNRTDAVACVGDIVDGLGSADACCQLIQDRVDFVVRGNHDRWFLSRRFVVSQETTQHSQLSDASVAFLESLPVSLFVATEGGLVLLCHGLADRDMEGVWPDEPDDVARDRTGLRRIRDDSSIRLVVNGHTHHRMVRSIDGIPIVNAGTLSRSESPTVTIVDFEAELVTFFDIVLDAVSLAQSVRLPSRSR